LIVATILMRVAFDGFTLSVLKLIVCCG